MRLREASGGEESEKLANMSPQGGSKGGPGGHEWHWLIANATKFGCPNLPKGLKILKNRSKACVNGTWGAPPHRAPVPPTPKLWSTTNVSCWRMRQRSWAVCSKGHGQYVRKAMGSIFEKICYPNFQKVSSYQWRFASCANLRDKALKRIWIYIFV